MRKTGWLPGREPAIARKSRAVLTQASVPARGGSVAYCPTIRDQGGLQSCTSHALLMALETLKIRAGTWTAPLSRLQLYYDQRAILGTVRTDSGASIASGIQALAATGVAREVSWPYTEAAYATRPSAGVYSEAASVKLRTYQQLTTQRQVKQALAANQPVVVGLYLRKTFREAKVGGVVPMPLARDKKVADHVVCLFGYGQMPGYFVFANSEGTGWGDGGFGYLPEGVIGDANFSSSYWAIQG